MSPGSKPRRYDAVIVGGGHNALVAAAYLARAGRSCLVLERRAKLGGAVASAQPFPGVEARLSRYSYLVSLLPRAIVNELGLPLRLARRRVSSYTPDPRAGARRGLLVQRDDESCTRASFVEVTGGEGAHEAWREHHARVSRLARVVFPTLTEPLRSRDELRARLDDDALWEDVFERPLGDWLLSDDLLGGLVLTDGLIGTFAPATGGELRQNRCFLYHVIGRETGQWLVPVGGMGALTAALLRAARAAGADLRANSEVLAIDPDEHDATVRFDHDGAEHSVTARHVLVNAAPHELGRLLGSPAPAGPPPEGSALKLNLVLSRLPHLKDRAISPELAFTGTFHVNETAEQLQRAYEEAAAGAIAALPPCEAYCHTLTDPSILGEELRVAGAHTLTVFGLHMPARLFRADPDRARADALEATMRSLDSVLGEPLEECLLCAADGKPCLEVHTPLDLERELRMPGGHIFHRDLAWPFAERDEEVGMWGVETTHPAILLCGAGARRGGGVSGIPGRNAAMAALGEDARH